MSQPANAPDPGILIYHNGHKAVVSQEEAYRLFWRTEFCWLLPLDWYRFSIGGHSGRGYLTRTTGRAARVLGYYLMRRGHLALTLSGFRMLDPKSQFIGSEAFYARMARFNRIFGDLPAELRPFEFFEAIEPGPESAYRLKPEREVIMVVSGTNGPGEQGLASRSPTPGFPDDPIDWTAFLTPPESLEAKE